MSVLSVKKSYRTFFGRVWKVWMTPRHLAAAFLASMALFAANANASAEKCNSSICVRVVGSSTHVDYVQVKMVLTQNYGDRELDLINIWGDGFNYYTALWGTNHSRWKWRYISSDHFKINRDLPDGSYICASDGLNENRQKGRVCVQIQE
jgi:hypothetical protein